MWWRQGIAQGDALAEDGFGWAYARGLGTPRDDKTAVYWYRKAAAQGDAVAEAALGWAYLHGQGVPKDHTQAAVWFRKAAPWEIPGVEAALHFLDGQQRGPRNLPAPKARFR